jgi:putative flippase GtrA
VTAKDFVRTLYRSRFVRFGFVGGLGFFVNEAALVLAQRLLHAGPHFGWFLAFLPSVVFTWWGNRTVTFAAASSRTVSGMAMEFCRFVATNSLGALANFVVYALMIGFAPFPLNVPYLALVAGVFVGLIFNFTLSKRLVFRS